MSEKVQFPETVMLIDVAYLNLLVADIKKNFESMLQRSLPDIDLADLMTYLALDAAVTPGENEIQVILVYDENNTELKHCHPSSLKEELNGVAFKSHLGEFSFSSISPEDITSRQELYLDLLQLVTGSEDVKKAILVGFEEEYGNHISTYLASITKKQLVRFMMFQPQQTADYSCEILAYPIMQAMGIKGDEL